MTKNIWEEFAINAKDKMPLYKQIIHQVEGMVHDGRLKPGTRLPSERKMAKLLNVSRMTITLANEEMKARGMVRSHQGSGTFILRGPRAKEVERDLDLPVEFAYPTGEINQGMDEIMRHGENTHLINLAGVGTAPEVHPGIELSQCFSEHLRKNPILLQLPSPTQGYEPLRLEMISWLKKVKIEVKLNEIMIVSGAMQGLDLISRLFLKPGDYVVMEEPGFLGAADAFKATGAKILRITLDEEGIRLDSLENMLMQFPIKFIYVNPTYQNPTGVTMSLKRRKKLLELCSKYGVLIVEDDPFSLLYFEDKPAPPIKSLGSDNVIYIQSFSKYLYPGIRLAVLVANEGIIHNLSKVKQRVDLHSNNLTQIALHAYISEGNLENHIWKLKSAYLERLHLMKELLNEGPYIHCKLPEGGVFLWCKVPKEIPTDRLLEFAVINGFTFVPGNWMSGVGMFENYIRLAYTHPSLEWLKKGIKLLHHTILEYKEYQF
ncbi:PLP-dependent aminotransferase family protein [Bacillus sp. APMAM]|nr:PLP-dependent aminotransferase family protein [Bacillus sp. APMAM]RTZ54671.1 PLP-dependent aminotransferase family protein [Bacillus sp. SAJ1]